MKTMKNIRLLGIISTLRSQGKLSLFNSILQQSAIYEHIAAKIYTLGNSQKISNSEALLLAALFGAKEVGAECYIFKLKDFILQNGNINSKIQTLENLITNNHGFILSTPVYFGDRSSYLSELIQILKKESSHLPLDRKAIGIVSVGAKRNGGQETTNVYALWECLEMGACITGNGPPTSQYGGTGWAGNIGAIIDDNFGLLTSKGTGRRVALLSRVLNTSTKHYKNKINILFLITRNDSTGTFERTISNLPFSSQVDLEILDVSKLEIKRCNACPVCPKLNTNTNQYSCIISKDDMKVIREHMLRADAIVIAHCNTNKAGQDKFQIFIERTRFIRRNNFELSNKAFSFFSFSDSAIDILPLRAMTSFLRHNLFIIGPFYIRYITNNIYTESISLESFSKRLESFTLKAKLTKIMQLDKNLQYIPIGY